MSLTQFKPVKFTSLKFIITAIIARTEAMYFRLQINDVELTENQHTSKMDSIIKNKSLVCSNRRKSVLKELRDEEVAELLRLKT